MKITARITRTTASIPGLLALLLLFPGSALAADEDQALWDEVLMVAAADEASMSEDKQWAEEGAETCLECHDDPEVMGITHRAHSQMGDSRTPFAGRQCEACHGARPQLLDKPAEGE